MKYVVIEQATNWRGALSWRGEATFLTFKDALKDYLWRKFIKRYKEKVNVSFRFERG